MMRRDRIAKKYAVFTSIIPCRFIAVNTYCASPTLLSRHEKESLTVEVEHGIVI